MRKRDPKHKPCIALTLASLLLPLTAIGAWLGDARPMMGTEVSAYVWHDEPGEARKALDAVFAEAERINQLMSTYIADSAISEVNRRAAHEPVAPGEELVRLIQRSLEVSALTRGAFDVTYDSVGQHYDFRRRVRPDQETVDAAQELIDYRFVEIDKVASTVRFREEGVRINLGGIAKGYVVERGVEILRRYGVSNGIVTAGGDSRLLGDRRGRPWIVGIRDPREDGKVAISVPLEDEAVSTSGDYERYFDEEGVRYHHILEPGSGAPAGKVRSATVFGPDAVITDALSTSVFVLGVDEGLRLIATLPDYECIVIDANGELYYSAGLQAPESP